MPKFGAVCATVPATDFERAKAWYAEKVGLKTADDMRGGAYFDIGSSRLLVYPSTFAGTNAATAATTCSVSTGATGRDGACRREPRPDG